MMREPFDSANRISGREEKISNHRLLLCLLLLAGAAPGLAEEVLFRVDFEDGLRAVGSSPPEPAGAPGGGYEVRPEGSTRLRRVVLESASPAQGKHCLGLGGYAVWHVGRQDVLRGRLSFFCLPLSLPSEGQSQELVWGGDIAKPYQTLSLTVDHRGVVRFNYFSWQKKQTWLAGVTTRTGLSLRRWNHIDVTWGEQGQRVYLNGRPSAANPERYPLSWLFDIRFGGLPCYLDAVELADTEQPCVTPPITARWRPTNPMQQDLMGIEKEARQLVRRAPKGSDAYCRGLVITYSSRVCWGSTFEDPPGELAKDNVGWMKRALSTTRPAWRRGEKPVPPFEARRKLRVQGGRLVQGGQPVFLLGNYSPTPIDSEIGLNFGNALMAGPDYALPGPTAVGDRGDGLARSIDEAQAKNRTLDVLLSLNIPDWLFQSDPTAKESGCGWFRFNIEAPSVLPAFRAATDLVMPSIKGHGANLILNLANEPACQGYSPNTTAPRWRVWLMGRHRTIERLNEAWGTHYSSFLEAKAPETVKAEYADCADPGGIEVPTDPKTLGQWYDWCIFNQQRYAAFFRQIRDNLARHRPEALFTIKWLSNFSGWWKSIGYALNPYDVTKLCDFGGCDAWTLYAGLDPKEGWGMWWDDFARHYDLLRSIAPDKPVLNSENHLLRGYDPSVPRLKYGTYQDVLPWQFFYTALWEQAIHGQTGSEVWTYWERGQGYNPDERAKALDAMGQAARDLRRYAHEVTALSALRPQVAVLLSSAALAWSPKEHVEAEKQAYQALALLGVPVGFMLEEMLPDGALDRTITVGSYRLLVVPQAVHLSRAMNEAITGFVARGGTVVALRDRPAFDEYGKPLRFVETALHWPDMGPQAAGAGQSFDPAHAEAPSSADAGIRKLHLRLGELLRQRGLASPVQVRVAGRIPFGIEWRATEEDSRRVISLCNFTNRLQEVAISAGGKPFRGVNLLDGQGITGKMRLAPLEVALLRGASRVEPFPT